MNKQSEVRDSALLDVHVAEGKRPWLHVTIDPYSRMILSHCVNFTQPTLERAPHGGPRSKAAAENFFRHAPVKLNVALGRVRSASDLRSVIQSTVAQWNAERGRVRK